MKAWRTTLVKWSKTDSLDVDWPWVHQQVGESRIGWINQQNPTKCQLVIEHTLNHTQLSVEFYDAVLWNQWVIEWINGDTNQAWD